MVSDGTGLIGEATTFTRFGVVYVGMMLILVMTLPRKRILLPFFLVALYMTLGQQLVLAGFNLSVSRITLLFIWIRLLVKGEHRRFRASPLDKWIVRWLVVSMVINVILWRGAWGAIVANLGRAYDVVGVYFLFRTTITDYEDLRGIFALVCALAIPLSVLMIAEHFSGRNLFSVFGGVPEFTQIREGKLRCQGPFRHPILAGTFGATTLPFAIALVRDSDARVRRIGMASIPACLAIIYASASSGPVLACITVIAALLLWPMRTQMRLVRRAIVLALIALDLVMKAPIWYLLARMSDLLGMGTGYHRSALIDAAVRHFSEWALVGTVYTAHWMPYQLSSNPNMADITNQYIAEGVDGGAITLLLFIGILVSAYRRVGTGGEYARGEGDHRLEMTAWVVGASLTAHAVSYLSVSYFDQMAVFWFLCLSASAAVGAFHEVKTLTMAKQLPIVTYEGSHGQEQH